MASISNLNKPSGDYVHFDTELFHVIQNKSWARAVILIHKDRKLIEQLLPKQFSSLLHALRQDECSPEGTTVYLDMLHAPQMHDLDRYIPKQLEESGIWQGEYPEFPIGASGHCRMARRE